MNIGEFIYYRRKLLGLTLEEVGNAVGVSKSTVKKWETGFISNMKRDKIAVLAEILQANPADFINENIDHETPPQKSIYDYENILPLPKTYKVPLIGTIACGTPILAEENIEEYIDLSQKIKADFCLRCKGDSMINVRVFDGDIVFVRQQPDVLDGQIAVVLIDDEATLKRVFHGNNEITLRAENPTFPTRTISGYELENVRIQGLAVAFLSTIN